MMKISFTSTLKKIESSDAFKNFKEKNPSAYLCAGFFVLDYEQGKNQQQLDYSLENKRIFTFNLNEELTIKEAETIEGKREKLPEMEKEIKIDLDKIKKIVEKNMQEKKINKKIDRIIAILQKHNDKQIWNLNCMLKGLGILQVHIDCITGEILKFEKKNLFDFVKKVK